MPLIGQSGQQHVRPEANGTAAALPDDELPDLHSLALPHDYHKGLHEVILEAVVGQLIPFQELHGQLAQAVNSIYGNVQVLMAADIHKEV